MKRVAPFALALVGLAAFAQTTQRVRGTITRLDGDVLTVKSRDGKEIMLQYEDGTQKILVPPGTPIVTFVPGDRAALKPGETIFTTARVEEGGKLSTQRIQVSKDGVRPAH